MDIELVEIREFLATIPPFDQLPSEELERLPARLSIRYLRRGQAFPPSNHSGLYIIRQGAVELRDGGQQILGKLGEGDVHLNDCRDHLGQASSASGARPVGLAIEDSLVYILPCPAVAALRRAHPAMAAYVEAGRGTRLRTAVQALAAHPAGTDGLLQTPIEQLIQRAPVCAPPEATIREGAQRMTREGVTALLIVTDAGLEGLITDHDMRARCVAQGRSPETPLAEVMTRTLFTLPPRTPLFEGLIEMTRRDIHHLPIVDGGRLLGLVSNSDLVRFQTTHALYLARDVRRCESVDALSDMARQLPELQVQTLAAGATAEQLGQTVSAVTDALVLRLIELGEARLGSPPGPYAWLVAGSQARREQTVHSDQDHAMLLADTIDATTDGAYFQALSEFVVDGLERCGLPPCRGNIMASNPQWRQTATRWRRTFSGWIQQPTQKSVYLASNFFDLRAVHDPLGLYLGLQEAIVAEAHANRIFLAYLAATALQGRPPLGFFRNLVVIAGGEHAKTLDLKHGGLLPIIDLTRVHALAAGVTGVSTQERLTAAAMPGGLSAQGASELRDAFELIGIMRARHQAEQIRTGISPDNFLAPGALSPQNRAHLKDAFGIINLMQRALAQQFQTARFI